MRLVKVGDYTLNPYRVGELAALAMRAWEIRRDDTIKMLADAQAGEDASVREMKALYSIKGTRAPALTYALTINGARDIVTKACKDQNVSPAIVDELEPDDLIIAAAALIGHYPDNEVQGEPSPGE